MTLLTMVFAAVICTVIWYNNASKSGMNIGFLTLMYWGASFMWLADAIFEYAELGAEYFTPSLADMLNDFYLGLSAVAFGLCIWIVNLLAKDPKGVVKNTLFRKK